MNNFLIRMTIIFILCIPVALGDWYFTQSLIHSLIFTSATFVFALVFAAILNHFRKAGATP